MARRRLTPDERSLWDRIARSTQPLRSPLAKGPVADRPAEAFSADPPPTSTPAPAPAPAPVSARSRLASTAAPPGPPPRVAFNLAPDPMDAAAAAPRRMDKHRATDLRRGRLRPEAKLDLHGMTADRAHRELAAFIHRSHHKGKRLLLVITGKGRDGRDDGGPMPDRRGVLRHALPRWLEAPDLRPLVLDLMPAHVSHGGGGAWYVYLARRRKP